MNTLTSRKVVGSQLKDLKLLQKAITDGVFYADDINVKKEIRWICGYELPKELWNIVTSYLITPTEHPIWNIRQFLDYALPVTASETFEKLYAKYYDYIPILNKKFNGYVCIIPFMDMDCVLSGINDQMLDDDKIQKIVKYILDRNPDIRLYSELEVIKQYCIYYLQKHNMYKSFDTLKNKQQRIHAFSELKINHCCRYQNRPDNYFSDSKYRDGRTCHTSKLALCLSCKYH